MSFKKMIIILVVLLLIILIMLGIILIYRIQKENYSYSPATEKILPEIDKKLTNVKLRNDFYVAKTCIEKYYLYLSQDNKNDYSIIDEEVEQTLEEEKNIKKQAIYSMLDDRYIKSRGIDENNVLEKVEEIPLSDININNIYVSQQDENMYVFIVYGKLINETTKEKQEFNTMLIVDMLNRTFKVVPQEYIKEYITEINIGEELKINLEKSIEKNNYNIFEYENVSDETYIIDIFNEFKKNMMYDYKQAYENLELEYKEKRFGTYEKFEEYAKNNIKNSVIMKLNAYQINKYENYTQYICKDQNENYYIFNETGIMDYTVILDTYTIDLPQFTEKYNNSTDAEKVLLNIQKVFEAINHGDYKYVYNKLDNEFKQNNFPTETEFDNYIKQNLYKNNSISYGKYKTSGNLHIYDINIKNKDDKNSITKTKNIIMRLEEGTDFVMSFNVN